MSLRTSRWRSRKKDILHQHTNPRATAAPCLSSGDNYLQCLSHCYLQPKAHSYKLRGRSSFLVPLPLFYKPGNTYRVFE